MQISDYSQNPQIHTHPEATDIQPARFTLEQFMQMTELGFFENKRVELIRGEIIVMPITKPPHAAFIRRLTRMCLATLGTRASVSPQCPVIQNRVLDDYLEPDVALLTYDENEYSERDVTPADTLLAIEVSDSTLRYDRLTKTVLYAEYGIPEVWIINVKRNELEVYREPNPEGYGSKQSFERGVAVAPLAFPDDLLEWW
jgi:Uma2 family endonuclease